MKKEYKSISYKKEPSGYMIEIDGKIMHTPMGKPLLLPTERLAEAVAEEWKSSVNSSPNRGEVGRGASRIGYPPTSPHPNPPPKGEGIKPLTQITNIAIDLAAERREALLADILPYAETDLLCYRAGDDAVL